MKVKLSARARADLRHQIDWLYERSPQAAERATDAIFEAMDTLSRYPLSGVEIEPSVRETPVEFGRHGYILQYKVGRSIVTVGRVFHGAQDRRRG